MNQPAHTTIRTQAPRPTTGARRRLEQARAVIRDSPLVDAAEAAKLLGVPPTWLQAKARQQQIPHHRLGHYVRFDLDELITWLEQAKVTPRRR